MNIIHTQAFDVAQAFEDTAPQGVELGERQVARAPRCARGGARRLQKMCLAGAAGPCEPSNAAACVACEGAHVLERLQVWACEKACKYGAILQPDTER
jgi:hypothetical protein